MSKELRRADLEGWVDRQAPRAVEFFTFVKVTDGSQSRARVLNLSDGSGARFQNV